jgi:translation initiation factor IF-2
VEDHPPGQVGPGQPVPDAGRVAGVGAVVPGQVQGSQPVREPRCGLEELEQALALDPVGDAQEGRVAPPAKVGRRAVRGGGQVAARRHHPDPLGREPLAGQLVAPGPGWPPPAGGPAGRRGGPAGPGGSGAAARGRSRPAAGGGCPPAVSPAAGGVAMAPGRRRRCCPAPARRPGRGAARPGRPGRGGGRGGRGPRRSGRWRRRPGRARPCGDGSGSRRSGGRGHRG